MTPEHVFSICTVAATAGWILLIVTPRRSWASTLVAGRVIPLLLAGVYFIVLGAPWGERTGGFNSLAGVAALFSNQWLLLGGWIHYLAFDLFVGSWEVRDAEERKISYWLAIPCVGLTSMLGPIGLLSYFAVRSAAGKLHAE
jgi:hypothetical protein